MASSGERLANLLFFILFFFPTMIISFTIRKKKMFQRQPAASSWESHGLCSLGGFQYSQWSAAPAGEMEPQALSQGGCQAPAPWRSHQIHGSLLGPMDASDKAESPVAPGAR